MNKTLRTFMKVCKLKITHKVAFLVLFITISALVCQGQSIPSDQPLTYTVGYSTGNQDSWEHIGMIPFWAGFMGATDYYGMVRPHHHSQTIYTENKLQPIIGSKISKISYRINKINSVASFNWQAKGEIKLAATGETNVRYGFVDIASLSPVAVCYGDFKYSNRIMEFEFEEPFIYMGGNLVVDMMKYAGTGVDYSVSFMGGSTCYADDPWDQEWKKNPDNWVSRLHLTVNKKENYNEAWHRFPEITFYFTPLDSAEMAELPLFSPGNSSQSGSVAYESNSESLQNDNTDVTVYSQANNIYIKNWSKESLQEVQVSDMMGRVIYKGTITSAETMIPIQGANGIYNVKLTSQNQVSFFKKVSIIQ